MPSVSWRYVGPENVDELRDMSFVFMCFEGPAKKLIVDKLEEFGLAFIDVGMGVYPLPCREDAALSATGRCSKGIPTHRQSSCRAVARA